ncbi:hypothetical protein BD410DRAFT_866462 [Rickenella mellea]|uniref:Uncharacterized protein n=1 Tax=Rickenella mellea TaxID=50990 RepID=A0A4Y7Q2I9_9AGAM|nr:hypothetical protein BD410DRAFT_866462 [Rickenella mellea]
MAHQDRSGRFRTSGLSHVLFGQNPALFQHRRWGTPPVHWHTKILEFNPGHAGTSVFILSDKLEVHSESSLWKLIGDLCALQLRRELAILLEEAISYFITLALQKHATPPRNSDIRLAPNSNTSLISFYLTCPSGGYVLPCEWTVCLIFWYYQALQQKKRRNTGIDHDVLYAAALSTQHLAADPNLRTHCNGGSRQKSEHCLWTAPHILLSEFMILSRDVRSAEGRGSMSVCFSMESCLAIAPSKRITPADAKPLIRRFMEAELKEKLAITIRAAARGVDDAGCSTDLKLSEIRGKKYLV